MAGLNKVLAGKGAGIVGTWVIVFLWVFGSMSIRTHVVVSRLLMGSRGCLAATVGTAFGALRLAVARIVVPLVQWVLSVCVGCIVGMPSG